MDIVSWITPEEQEQTAAAVVEAQRCADEFTNWLRSPEGVAWGNQVLQECRAMTEEFEAEVATGKFALSAEELEQLRRDAEEFAEEVKSGKLDLTPAELEQLQQNGTLTRKCHPTKRKGERG